MAKRIQISPDNRTTWYTLPGDKGEYHDDAEQIKDTIFGYDYASNQTGMISWNISANGLYKGFAGYVATIKQSGSPTAVTGEAFTLVSGKTYKITNASKNVWQRTVTPVIKDNGVTVAANNILSIDFLFGQVTFTSGYSVTGPITGDLTYLPITQIAKAQSFTLTQTAATIDNTDFEVAQANNGYRTFEYGLKTVSLAMKGIFASSNAFSALLAARAEAVIEIQPSGDTNATARGFFKPSTHSETGNVGELEEEDLTFTLSVPDQSSVLVPFSWQFSSSSSLSRAVREAILAWQSGTLTDVNYLEDGTNGHAGDAVVTDVTLTGGLSVMNDFAMKFQGSGAPVAFP